MEALGAAYIFLVLLGVAISIAWILLPFAMFGTKPLLRALISEQQRTNKLLAEVVAQGARTLGPPT